MSNSGNRQPISGPLCAHFAPLLPALDDLTDIRLAAETYAHLAECAWCRAQRATYDHFDAALRLHFAPDAMPILSDSAMRFIMPDIDNSVGTLSPETATEQEDDAPQFTISPLPMPNPPRMPHAPHTPQRSWRLAAGAGSLAAVLVISLLAGLIFMSHGRPTASGTQKVATPTAIPGHIFPNGIHVIGMSSATDGWAMGADSTMLHYTNGRWTPVETHIPTNPQVIKMFGPNDGWALGYGVYHYDGKSWQEVAQFSSAGLFRTISALSPTNFWIAGEIFAGSRESIYHYDGRSWTIQVLPALPTNMAITSLAMLSATEGWAVGTAQGAVDAQGNARPSTAVILRYHHGAWSVAQTLPNHEMLTIAMSSATDGWIGGDVQTYYDPPVGQSWLFTDPALWRYQGGRWVEAPIPQRTDKADTSGEQITQVTLFSATDGWMSIMGPSQPSNDGSMHMTPDLFRLKQGRWVQIQTPTIGQQQNASMYQMSFVSRDEFWAVGETFGTAGSNHLATETPFLVHYKDGAWTVVEQ